LYPALILRNPAKEVRKMLQEVFDTIVLLLPVFLLLAMMFGAGFLIGRVSKKNNG
jgi:hypothetical protein